MNNDTGGCVEHSATTGARNDGYAALMARMFLLDDAAGDDDDLWLQSQPPLCPGWGVEEWVGKEDDDSCQPWPEDDWERTTHGSGIPELVYNNDGQRDKDEEDGKTTEANRLQREVEAERQVKDETKRTEEARESNATRRTREADEHHRQGMHAICDDFVRSVIEAVTVGLRELHLRESPTPSPSPPGLIPSHVRRPAPFSAESRVDRKGNADADC